jgi:PIN domain nuclease of toxin-antitoxin system
VTRYLLDTHVWLWLQVEPDRVGERLLARLSRSSNELLLSAASSWEIAIKHGLGKLALPASPEVYVPERLRRSGTTPLPIEHSHVLRVGTLPPHHRDPFDRVLVAQAQLLSATLVTADEQLRPYDVDLVLLA